MHQDAKCSNLAGWIERNYLRLQQQSLEKVPCHFEVTAPWSCSGAYCSCSQKGCKHYRQNKLQTAARWPALQPLHRVVLCAKVSSGSFEHPRSRSLHRSWWTVRTFGPVAEAAQRHSRFVHCAGGSVRWGYALYVLQLLLTLFAADPSGRLVNRL